MFWGVPVAGVVIIWGIYLAIRLAENCGAGPERQEGWCENRPALRNFKMLPPVYDWEDDEGWGA